MNDAGSKQTDALEKKSVLLVDVNVHTRESRAANMRKLGASVDPASNATMALQLFGAGSYKLVLIDLGRDKDGAESLAREIRLKHPGQQIGFMVAGPTLIATTLEKSTKTKITAVAKQVDESATDGETAFGRAVRNAEQQSREPDSSAE